MAGELERPKKPNVMQKRRAKERALMAGILDDIAFKAAKQIGGLFLDKDAPGYNADADRVWADVSVKTRVSLEVYKESMAGRREDRATERQLGVLVLKERLEGKRWEEHARAVDEAERERLARQVIDVEAKATT